MARGELFEGGDYFKDFRQREAIIKGRLLFEEIRYFFILVFRQSFENSSITIF